ncbi:hypothetical protein Patl1_29939 [Pistacia atlantica]|uniref:Uncharacterized protein n=1 Tax=Pistacia atlantica TaxID=434234 RepID=A0ACC1ACR1_9ROSI|nr:hypothetical protein Patl1_29939 [Pistacia atlantica]
MQLVNFLFTSNENYLAWSRSILIALGAKQKLGFINGKIYRSEQDSDSFELWSRFDYMIRSWLLNSVSSDIVGAFLYASTAKELWNELKEHYGESNGPLIYERNETISKYYTKLKKLWDELNCILPVPDCSCGSRKKMNDINFLNRLMQFLMRLNDSYDQLRSQILVLEPLPTINKAYFMTLKVEKQREVHINFSDSSSVSAMFAKAQMNQGNNSTKKYGNSGSNYNGGNKNKQKNRKRNGDKNCDFCNQNGHTREFFFSKS